MAQNELTPVAGMPATIHLRNDSIAAVVVRVNAKSLIVAKVAVKEDTRHRINSDSEPYPCWAWEGDTDVITGTEERFPIVHTSYGTRYRNGSISVTLGKSLKVTDHRS